MPFDREFLHHLHELMVEVSEELTKPNAAYKAELIWKAQQTHNAAAMPIAYMDAAIHAFRTRIEKTIEKYIEALSIWGIDITPAVEKDMIQQFIMLTAGPRSLHFPPGIRSTQVQAVQGAYARERDKVANQLVRQGTNRLRELKVKMKNAPQPVSPSVTNINMPGSRTYINSVDQSTNITITTSNLQDIDSLSVGHPELQAVANEVRTAQPQATMIEKLQKWVSLANSIEGLAEKIHQYYPQLESLILNLSHWAATRI